MELRHFRYFQAVAEELSFSKAARRLRIAQPALSRAVKELEEQMGAVLMHRNRRAVSLTEAGTVLLHETGILFQRVDEAVRRVQRTAKGEEGELRVGYIGPPTQAFLGRLLAEFRRRYPRVSVVLEERTPERVWEMVARGRLEIGLTRPVPGQEARGLRTMLLRREPFHAVFPPAHPLAGQARVPWKALAGEPLVILSRREGVGMHDAILAACRRARFTPRLAHTPSVIHTVLSYVEAGAGAGIVPDSIAAAGAGGPLVFRPLVPEQSIELVMVWADAEVSRAGSAFRTLLAEQLRSGELLPVPARSRRGKNHHASGR
jgi:DNA-binding transcriptional LysR family regulator